MERQLRTGETVLVLWQHRIATTVRKLIAAMLQTGRSVFMTAEQWVQAVFRDMSCSWSPFARGHAHFGGTATQEDVATEEHVATQSPHPFEAMLVPATEPEKTEGAAGQETPLPLGPAKEMLTSPPSGCGSMVRLRRNHFHLPWHRRRGHGGPWCRTASWRPRAKSPNAICFRMQ